MVAAKKIPIEEVAETRELLEQAVDQPVIVEFNGRRFRVVEVETEQLLAASESTEEQEQFEREAKTLAYARDYILPRVKTYGSAEREAGIDPFANYDPEKALASMRKVFGILKGVDIEALKEEIRIDRGHEPRNKDAE
jgi:hypothetical protein